MFQLTETLLSGIAANLKENQELQPLQSQEKEQKPVLSLTEQSQKSKQEQISRTQAISEMVKVCFDSQDTFGKTPDQLPNILKAFIFVLKNYSIQQIQKAFTQWLDAKTEFPKPADIKNLIDPPKAEWKPDWAVYISLKQKVQREWYYLCGSEREFVRKCEQYAIDRALNQNREPLEVEAHKVAVGLITYTSPDFH